MRFALLILLVVAVICPFAQLTPSAQTQATSPKAELVYLPQAPSHIFDGEFGAVA